QCGRKTGPADAGVNPAAVDLAPLYSSAEPPAAVSSDRRRIHTSIGGTGFAATLPAQRPDAAPQSGGRRITGKDSGHEPAAGAQTTVLSSNEPALVTLPPEQHPSSDFHAALSASADAHAAYLSLATTLEQSISRTIARQFALLRQGAAFTPAAGPEQGRGALSPPPVAPAAKATPPSTAVVFDRSMCLEFAVGSVAAMLGAAFAEVDSFPTRVRLPDEPLMLVDRIVALEGTARSMSSGRVVTEHDVTADRWYLDGGRIPTCIAVEAGQADLFLSGYLGIDFITRGKAVYRLLDAVVTFHRGLPVVGETIRYDIRIERFFRQDQTYLFRFNFEATVAGEPLLSMRNGCAGFFSAAELAAGRGIVHTRLDQQPQPGRLPDDWRPLVAMAEESYSDEQISALYAGDLGGCFGSLFAALPLHRPYTLPGGQLKLVDRVISLDPHGGRYGLGRIVAEMDIVPDAWFLTCHFVDDRVMPGTLMYECCMHTLRIYLLRMGWIGESGTTWCEPVPGVDSGLKCRGQVIETTRKVTYQVSIKELGYRPEPYAIVDALMFADGHPIVEIPDMSVRLAGLDRDQVEALWSTAAEKPAAAVPKTVLFDTDRITAFAIGNPSAAFGEPYRVFDHERRIARLPGPPFQFLDRIVAITGAPWKLAEGAIVTAEYDVPADAWYFAAGRSQRMPFSVLLEVALQPCGWLAAYLGSALTSPTDLSFRNLDGQAVQHRPVTVASGTLTTQVELTRVASSAGMIIQGYRFSVSDAIGPVYSGTTLFGFFSAAALAEQVGIRAAKPWQPSAAQEHQALRFAYPQEPPFADTMLRMVDEIELYSADGGPQGLGFIRGSKKVDPAEWFFKAHFYQDPVCPGSLGLESFLQLLQVAAARRWGVTPEMTFETLACGQEHSWNYRGQIIPTNERIVIEAVITAVDDAQKILHGDGFLIVDGKVIYQMKQFSLRLLP
ncbi:MAG: type I polyketide synthase, partial [Pelovirga sp.]